MLPFGDFDAALQLPLLDVERGIGTAGKSARRGPEKLFEIELAHLLPLQKVD
jgi:hypothetical protein